MFQPAASATPIALVLKHARGRQQAQPSRTTGPSCDDTMHFHFSAQVAPIKPMTRRRVGIRVECSVWCGRAWEAARQGTDML